MKKYEEEIDGLNQQLKNVNREIQDCENKCARAESNAKENEMELNKYKNERNSLEEKDLKKNRHIE